MQKYKIPQNVQIEDKIFGNILTLKQLIIIGIGGAISYILYNFLARTYILGVIETGFISIPGLIAIAFAFIKINNISLFKFCLLFLEFIIKPNIRVWNKSGDIVLTLKLNPPKVNKKTNNDKPLNKQDTLSNLDKISRMVDLSNK